MKKRAKKSYKQTNLITRAGITLVILVSLAILVIAMSYRSFYLSSRAGYQTTSLAEYNFCADKENGTACPKNNCMEYTQGSDVKGESVSENAVFTTICTGRENGTACKSIVERCTIDGGDFGTDGCVKEYVKGTCREEKCVIQSVTTPKVIEATIAPKCVPVFGRCLDQKCIGVDDYNYLIKRPTENTIKEPPKCLTNVDKCHPDSCDYNPEICKKVEPTKKELKLTPTIKTKPINDCLDKEEGDSCYKYPSCPGENCIDALREGICQGGQCVIENDWLETEPVDRPPQYPPAENCPDVPEGCTAKQIWCVKEPCCPQIVCPGATPNVNSRIRSGDCQNIDDGASCSIYTSCLPSESGFCSNSGYLTGTCENEKCRIDYPEITNVSDLTEKSPAGEGSFFQRAFQALLNLFKSRALNN